MRTSRDIYNQIIWDPSFDPNSFIIGCRERSKKIKEIPLLQFSPETVPWDRVVYIKLENIIVWDRKERLDKFGDGSIRELLQKHPQATRSQDPQGFFTSLPIYRYQEKWEKVSPCEVSEELALLRPVKIVTWNVLFDIHQKEQIYTDKRIPFIFIQLQKINADIIALQEVTKSFYQKLLQQSWVRENYFISDSPTPATLKQYGQVILSRFPVQRFAIHNFSRDKKIVVGQVIIAEKVWWIINLHLSSSRAKDAVQKRREQLQELHLYLQSQLPLDACIVLGDFNFGELHESGFLKENGFLDAWEKQHGSDSGYTYFPEHNSLAKITTKTGIAARYDRIFYHKESAEIARVDTKILATQPKYENGEEIFASDHFALCSEFYLKNPKLRPTYRSSLVIIPPQEVWQAIQEIREKHDKSFARWMPHINLLYGFLDGEFFAEAEQILRQHLAQFPKFQISLEEFFWFSHHSSHTAWLQPKTQLPGRLYELQKLLQKIFPQCSEQGEKSSWGYTPHLSVGQFSDVSVLQQQISQWQQNWKNISFTVSEICLIRRGDNTPFTVNQRIPLGNSSQWLATSQDHATHITPFVDIVRQTYAQYLKENHQNPHNELVFIVGSHHLECSGEDLDILCIGNLERDTFFAMMQQRLVHSQWQQHMVKNSLVPVLKICTPDFYADIQYARFPEEVELCYPLNLSQEDLQVFSTVDRRTLNSYLQSCQIIEELGETFSIFREVLPMVKTWAKARQIYSNSLGYLGGISWTILLAWVCKHREFSTKDELLLAFFETWSQWDWKRPVSLSHNSHSYSAQHKEPMQILTPDAHQNTCRNVYSTSASVLNKEFQRGYQIIKNHEKYPKELLAPFTLDNYPYRLNITIRSSDIFACRGWMEGKFLSFALKLEKACDFLWRPVFSIRKDDQTEVFTVLMQKKIAPEELQKLSVHLKNTLRNWENSPSGSSIEITSEVGK